MQNEIAEKETLLVLGASSDLGSDLIRACDPERTRVVAHYFRSKDVLSRLASEWQGEMDLVQADLSSLTEAGRMAENLMEKHGPPTQIVHFSASKFENIRFRQMDWDRMQEEIDLQLKSLFQVLKVLLPPMAKAGRGKILFVLSSCTLGMPPGFLSHYVTVKYAMLGFMKSLACEYASKGIQINAVSPSMVETRFLDKLPDKLVELTREAHPMKRNATTGDIVPVMRFLLSSESDYVTGVNLPACGGAAM